MCNDNDDNDIFYSSLFPSLLNLINAASVGHLSLTSRAHITKQLAESMANLIQLCGALIVRRAINALIVLSLLAPQVHERNFELDVQQQ